MLQSCKLRREYWRKQWGKKLRSEKTFYIKLNLRASNHSQKGVEMGGNRKVKRCDYLRGRGEWEAQNSNVKKAPDRGGKETMEKRKGLGVGCFPRRIPVVVNPGGMIKTQGGRKREGGEGKGDINIVNTQRK